jgi:large subunit ribosomal protein L49
LKYFVARSESNELPVYQLRKRGGNLLMTRIKKVHGDPGVLRDELRKVLGGREVVVNGVTGHVMIKGHVKGKVEGFLRERLF